MRKLILWGLLLSLVLLPGCLPYSTGTSYGYVTTEVDPLARLFLLAALGEALMAMVQEGRLIMEEEKKNG